MNVAEERKKTKKLRQCSYGQAGGKRERERENEWTTCSGGVLLAGFRGVEIPYNVRDVCVDSFNSIPGLSRVALSYT